MKLFLERKSRSRTSSAKTSWKKGRNVVLLTLLFTLMFLTVVASGLTFAQSQVNSNLSPQLLKGKIFRQMLAAAPEARAQQYLEIHQAWMNVLKKRLQQEQLVQQLKQKISRDSEVARITESIKALKASGKSIGAIQEYLQTGLKKSNFQNGSLIQGTVISEEDFVPISLALVVAFDMADTSIAGLGISMFGNYMISGLPAGEYVFYADADILLDLFSDSSTELSPQPYIGEFYENSPTPDGATKVTVAENDTISGINFTLAKGATISGTILGPGGVPLDSVIVLAFKEGFLEFDPFLTNLRFGFAISDQDGNYSIPGLPTGNYKLRTVTIIKHTGTVLDEWYENIYPLFNFAEATPVAVTVPEVKTGINFQLEAPAVITGRVTKSDGVTPIDSVDIVILAIDAETNMPALAFGQPDESGDYMLAPLYSGDFKLLALVDPESPYLSEFYDGVHNPDDANIVSVVAPEIKSGIDFSLDAGSIIQGHISGAPPELTDFPVVAYDATSGEVRGAVLVNSSGAYSITRLLPGAYKVCALPVVSPFAATYYGGGATFDDVNSTVINLPYESTFDADITLGNALGSITGMIYDEANDPLDTVMVWAYDQTGHIVSAGLSGVDLANESPLESGFYQVGGLHSGNYYVRTFSLYATIAGFEEQVSGEEEFDPLSLLGLLMGGELELKFYRDEWYNNVLIELPYLENISGMILPLILAGPLSEVSLFPFYALPTAGASLVSVTDPNSTPGIDFHLSTIDFKDLLVGVEKQPSMALPEKFALQQNYPNPVYPTGNLLHTVITYQLPVAMEVKVEIFNILGQKVVTLYDGFQDVGTHRVIWNGLDEKGEKVSSGIYFYSLRSKTGITQMKKMIVLR